MTSNPFIVYEAPYFFQVFETGEAKNQEVFILIHGWKGNENSMSIFLQSIPNPGMAILPRGIIPLGQNQFGWVDIRNSENNDFRYYQDVAAHLHKSILNVLERFHPDSSKKINLIGFSQGAAVSFIYSLFFANQINKVALLSGFMPKNTPQIRKENVNTIKYYVSHGKKDELVDYDQAVKLREYLMFQNAEVIFCAAEVGHKVSSDCLSALKSFFMQN